ncbi:MAG: helix-turn-helix domain-containing protein [Verrucomicrobiia bacterium]
MGEENSKNGNGAVTPLLHDIRGAAARLSMSPVSIRKLIRQNRLKRVADFRKILISEAELQRFATCG